MIRRPQDLLPRPLVRWLWQRRRDAAPRRRQRQALSRLRLDAAALSESCLARVTSLAQWQAARPARRLQLAEMLGLPFLQQHGLDELRLSAPVDLESHRLLKLVARTSLGTRITAHLHLPRATPNPVPAVVYLCGHSPHPDGAKSRYLDRILWYPRNGIACLALDPHGFGEIPGLHHGTQELARLDWLSHGYTPAGLETWTAMRLVDWLRQRPEIKPDALGVTGISGGGVMSFFLAALDERLAAAAPSCSAYTIGSQAALGLVPDQCDCTFYPNFHQLDFPEVAALIAPRPLLITAGQRDGLFPPAGYREVHRLARHIYELHAPGAGTDRLRLVDAPVGHEDAPAFLTASRSWMLRWLTGSPSTATTTAATASTRNALPPDPARLLCLSPSLAPDLDLHENQAATTALFPSAPRPIPATADAWEFRRAHLASQLDATTFAWFTHARSPGTSRPLPPEPGYAASYFEVSDSEFETEPGLFVRVRRFTPHSAPAAVRRLLVVLRHDGECSGAGTEEFLPLHRDTEIVVIHPRLSEITLDSRTRTAFERTAALTGRTLAACQVWDALQVIRPLLDTLPAGRSTHLYGRAHSAALALHVARLEPRLEHVLVADLPASHRSACPLLAVLRVTDLPELAAAIAPRALTCLPAAAGAPPLARSVYRLLGVEDRLQGADSLAEAVRRRTSDPLPRDHRLPVATGCPRPAAGNPLLRTEPRDERRAVVAPARPRA